MEDNKRPWGYWDLIREDHHFKVKKITVNPGKRLSLQSHEHRSEHWVIVIGNAKVRVGDDEHILSKNQSIYIPKNTKHRIENIGKGELIFLEIQLGKDLKEDDIIRLEDDYGRA